MKALRAGLLILFAGAVLAFGTVDVWSQSLLEAGAGALFVLWAVLAIQNPEARIQWSALNWPLLALIGIGLMQLLFRATANPLFTRVEVLKFVAYFLIFFLAQQAFRTREDFSVLAWFLMLLCFAVSLLGITQHFTSSGDIYWTDAFNVQTAFFGPYVNRNHFAGFGGIDAADRIGNDGIPVRAPRCAATHRSADDCTGQRPGAFRFTFRHSRVRLGDCRSRVAGTEPECGIVESTADHGRRYVGAHRAGARRLGGAGTAIERFSVLNRHDVSLGRRISMARGAAHIFLDYPLKGCGLGTLVDVIRAMRPFTMAGWLTTSTMITWRVWLKPAFSAASVAFFSVGVLSRVAQGF